MSNFANFFRGLMEKGIENCKQSYVANEMYKKLATLDESYQDKLTLIIKIILSDDDENRHTIINNIFRECDLPLEPHQIEYLQSRMLSNQVLVNILRDYIDVHRLSYEQIEIVVKHLFAEYSEAKVLNERDYNMWLEQS
ncbi:ORF66 protein [Operophtera brumata nucleopolyhedrovirus]|uniref:ORF66 protein n=1 Tax=Operophtera brumata nucleopolyhedrovirus TaxID=1046267 RepID=A0A2H4UZV1_9ABAC|nr:ORF66 protein [Operophtera brumata nucleopolyhedrovirus]AUA60297.1 ORF66 protein [Operophtera brumata nucleopolyhedrovirus]